MTAPAKVETMIETTSGEACRAVFLPVGSRYGRDDVLVADVSLVEFWVGTFVSRYHLSTLLGLDPWSRGDVRGRGICIHGGGTYDPPISIDGANCSKAFAAFAAAGVRF